MFKKLKTVKTVTFHYYQVEIININKTKDYIKINNNDNVSCKNDITARRKPVTEIS